MAQPALGFLLQYLRERRRDSLRDVGQLAGIDHAYIYRLETGGKDSPSEDVLAKLIKALRAVEREAEMLRYLAKHPETKTGLVEHVLKDNTVTFVEFASVAGAAFRGSSRPDYAKLIERMRRIIAMED